MQVTIQRHGQTAQAITVPDGASLADALRQEGVDAATVEAYVNAQIAGIDSALNEGDAIVLENRETPHGGTGMKVQCGMLPGRVKPLSLTEGATVADAIREAGITNTAGYEIKVNGSNAPLDQVLKQGDSVVLVRPVEGNTTSPESSADASVPPENHVG